MLSLSDHELVTLTKGGDSRAFGQLVVRHQRRIFRLAFHLLRSVSEAEDVMQEAFVRAYQAIDRFDGRSEPYTWLYRITVNLSLNAIRARKSKSKTAPLEDPGVIAGLVDAGPHANPATATQDRQLARALGEGIESLSDSLRTTLILVCVDGMPQDQAAAVLGCPEGTVAWRVHEARRRLRAYLQERGFGGET